MHLAHIKIENIRNLRRAEWRAPADQAGGWHVVPGENASGKTTFLRSIARTLLGFPGATQELDPNSWRREGAARGSVDIVLRGHAGFDKGELDPGQDEVASFTEKEDGEIDFSHLSEARGFGTLPNTLFEGWLSLGYGPYRRFTGGESRLEKYATPAYAPIERHLTLFNEGALLPEGVLWINKLGYRQLEEQNKKKTTRNGGHHEANGDAGSLMKNLRALLGRPGLLPHGAKLAEVSSEGLFFTIGRGKPRGILQLSDGYKSILSMLFDILRNMERSYGPNNIFDEEGRVVAPAVILIDDDRCSPAPELATEDRRRSQARVPQRPVHRHHPQSHRLPGGRLPRRAAQGAQRAARRRRSRPDALRQHPRRVQYRRLR